MRQKRGGSLERLGGEITDERYETMKSKLKIYKNSAVQDDVAANSLLFEGGIQQGRWAVFKQKEYINETDEDSQVQAHRFDEAGEFLRR